MSRWFTFVVAVTSIGPAGTGFHFVPNGTKCDARLLRQYWTMPRITKDLSLVVYDFFQLLVTENSHATASETNNSPELYALQVNLACYLVVS